MGRDGSFSSPSGKADQGDDRMGVIPLAENGVKTMGEERSMPEFRVDQAPSNDAGGGWILVNARILVGLIGAIACFSWLFVMLGTSIFIPFADLEGVATGAAHLSFLAGCCTALLA